MPATQPGWCILHLEGEELDRLRARRGGGTGNWDLGGGELSCHQAGCDQRSQRTDDRQMTHNGPFLRGVLRTGPMDAAAIVPGSLPIHLRSGLPGATMEPKHGRNDTSVEVRRAVTDLFRLESIAGGTHDPWRSRGHL